MNVTQRTEPAACKAVFERALQQLDDTSHSSVDARHRAIAVNKPDIMVRAKSQEQALKDAADALSSLWRKR
ncbi:MAG TPA: hypothetical protein VL983_01660 [Terriglobales bacterium]|nr:hypothetical protein [Terriglobales bacterium]